MRRGTLVLRGLLVLAFIGIAVGIALLTEASPTAERMDRQMFFVVALLTLVLGALFTGFDLREWL